MKKEINEKDLENEDKFWSGGSFIESINPKELKEKIKTLKEDSCKDIKFKCKKCNKQISAHNKDWHDEMCDDCFNAVHFPEDKGEVVEESLK